MVTVYWSSNKSPSRTKVIYKKEFTSLQSMDDLFFYSGIPIRGFSYVIQTNTITLFPWSGAAIIKELTIKKTTGDKQEFKVSMKRMYGR